MSSQPTVQHAILATDGSVHAHAATSLAGAMAWSPTATVTVASVVEAPDPGDLPIRAWEEQALADWRQVIERAHTTARDEAQRFIAEAAAVLRSRHPGLLVDEVICLGQPATELLSLARTTHAELIIAGARGRTALGSLLLGSVTEALAAEAPCPVLIVRDAISELQVVVVVVRTVADAERLAQACLTLPLPTTTKIIAVTAGAPRPQGDDARDLLTNREVGALLEAWDKAEQAETRAAGERFIERMQAGDPGRSVTARVIHGTLRPSAFESRADVAPALLAEAEALAADLIIVGAREHSGLAARLGLGSVSRKLVRRASSAVLVVREAPPA